MDRPLGGLVLRVAWCWRWRSVGRSGWLQSRSDRQADAVAACLRCGWSSAGGARGAGRTAQRWPADWPGGVSMLVASLPSRRPVLDRCRRWWPPWAGFWLLVTQPACRTGTVGSGAVGPGVGRPFSPCQASRRQRDPWRWTRRGVGPGSGRGSGAGGVARGGEGRSAGEVGSFGPAGHSAARLTLAARLVHRDPAWKERSDGWVPTLRQ
jgi:hypothetical protein